MGASARAVTMLAPIAGIASTRSFLTVVDKRNSRMTVCRKTDLRWSDSTKVTWLSVMIDNTTPGKPAPLPMSRMWAPVSGRKTASCAESRICRCQASASVAEETRLIRGCHFDRRARNAASWSIVSRETCDRPPVIKRFAQDHLKSLYLTSQLGFTVTLDECCCIGSL